MKTATRMVVSVAAAVLLSANAVSASADNWEFEITPYLWAAGVDADIVAGGQSASVDASFSDVLDALDIAGAFLLRAERNSWVVWTQFDYMALNTNKLDNAPANGSFKSDDIFLTAGFGREFENSKGTRSIDVLLGVRYLEMSNTLNLDGIGSFHRNRNFTDPVIILRPSLRLSERWRLNPTFSFGSGGDSESTYELQPQVQFQMTDRWALRFGYRKLYYDIKNDNGNSFKGSFQGPFVGVGGTFGG